MKGELKGFQIPFSNGTPDCPVRRSSTISTILFTNLVVDAAVCDWSTLHRATSSTEADGESLVGGDHGGGKIAAQY
jgi:hypothetical protein